MPELNKLSNVERILRRVPAISMSGREISPAHYSSQDARLNQLLGRKLYWFYELTDEETKMLREAGYLSSKSKGKSHKLRVRNENGQFEQVLCLLPRNENMQHMRDKEFIANLNRNASHIEYLVSGSQNRIDVVFLLKEKKIGIEVQNSALEYTRLKEKVSLLQEHFDIWFMIVPLKFVETYSYLSSKKGEVTTMKKAVGKIKEFLREYLV